MDKAKIEEGVRLILEGIGEDPAREGLLETPARVARMYEEVFAGLTEDPARHFETTFDEHHEEMVLVRDIARFLPESGADDFTPTARELFSRSGKEPDQAKVVGMALFLRRLYEYFFNHII